MAEQTAIAWTRSTRNLWAGCTKIGPGCDGCYAEAFQRWVQGKDPESGEAKNWGPGRPRTPYLDGAFKDLRKWNRLAAAEKERGTNAWRADQPAGFWPTFLNTQSDMFDNEAPQEWRDAAWPVLEECEHLSFQLVTKRIGNVQGMVPRSWLQHRSWPRNVRLMITVVNVAEAARDIPKLVSLECPNGISYEPALGPIDWWNHFDGGLALDWIIVGGESSQAGHRARPFDIEWARTTVRQCQEAEVPAFVKQLGSNPVWPLDEMARTHDGLKARAGDDIAEWPADIRVQEFPA